jgi:hypothetical protein
LEQTKICEEGNSGAQNFKTQKKENHYFTLIIYKPLPITTTLITQSLQISINHLQTPKNYNHTKYHKPPCSTKTYNQKTKQNKTKSTKKKQKTGSRNRK